MKMTRMFTLKSGKQVEDLPTEQEIAQAGRKQLIIWKRTMRNSFSSEDKAIKRLVNIRLEEDGHITIEEAKNADVPFSANVLRRRRSLGIA